MLPTGPVIAYECLWRGCDYQYEDLQDLKIHLLDNTCHLRKSGEFCCYVHSMSWRTILIHFLYIESETGRLQVNNVSTTGLQYQFCLSTAGTNNTMLLIAIFLEQEKEIQINNIQINFGGRSLELITYSSYK